MSIKVNTQVVENAAQRISRLNSRINSDYDEVDKIINTLASNWTGVSADCAQGKHRKIKKDFYDLRFSVVEQIPNFLKKQVGISYENVETTVKTAADAFK